MSEDNRHILQAAEEKLESLSAEIGRLHNELDRYSKAAVHNEKLAQTFRLALVKITSTGDNEQARIAREALDDGRV